VMPVIGVCHILRTSDRPIFRDKVKLHRRRGAARRVEGSADANRIAASLPYAFHRVGI
jgi:hypothetical protein